jgi:hypothetical protein
VNTDAAAPLRAAVAASMASDRLPVRAANRLMTNVREECARLAASPEGRAVLEHAAHSDEEPLVRLNAATAVETWNPSRAAAALEALIRASDGVVVRPMTMAAALAVAEPVARDAALCLFNLDRRAGAPAPPLTMARPVAQRPVVATELLDAAETVYSVAMNGGLEHAFEVDGERFNAAAEAFDAVGSAEAAEVLREVVRLIEGRAVATREDRAAAVAGLSRDAQDRLAKLNDRFLGATDLMDLIERADDT